MALLVLLTNHPPFSSWVLYLPSALFVYHIGAYQSAGLAEQDRIRAEIEYQVNLKAQSEIMRLQLKMDEVLKMLEEKKRSAAD